MATEAQRDYAARTAKRSTSRRRARVEQLRARRVAIERGTRAMARVQEHARISGVLIRDGFLWRPPLDPDVDRDERSLPPLARLIANSGEAFRLYLHGMFIAQALGTPGKVPPRFDTILNTRRNSALTWPSILALPGHDARNQRLRVQRAMRRLDDLGLANVPAGRRGLDYSAFALLDDEGSRERYVLPGGAYSDLARRISTRSAFLVPVEFFTRGWSAVLSDTEIAVYLLLLQLKHRHGARVRHIFVPRGSRLDRYALSDEVYAAHRGLEEFGLVRLGDVILGRRRGRLDPSRYDRLAPFRFELVEGATGRNAYSVVSRQLGRSLPAEHLRRTERSRTWLRGFEPDPDDPSPPERVAIDELMERDLQADFEQWASDGEPSGGSAKDDYQRDSDISSLANEDPEFGQWYFRDPQFERISPDSPGRREPRS